MVHIRRICTCVACALWVDFPPEEKQVRKRLLRPNLAVMSDKLYMVNGKLYML